jgi:predicted lipoprotein with Yx(FWY)xxD motif
MAVAALGLSGVLAACGGGSSNNVSSKNSKSSAASTTTAPAAPPTVTVASTSLGMVLVASNGHTLYELDKDTPTMAMCTGGCAGLWPPLTATGTPTGGTGVDATKLTILTGPNGMQVVYAGHPLYMFSQDSAPGDVKGQGFAGNIWHVVSPSGTPITTATTATTAAGASSSGSSGGSTGGSSGGSGGSGMHSGGGYGY